MTKLAEFRGTVMYADLRTHGGRIYPKPVVAGAVAKIKAKVKERYFFGGLMGNADFFTPEPTSLGKASHVITDLHFDENNALIADVEILDTPDGRLVKALLEEKAISLFPKGIGSFVTDANGINVIQPDYELTSIDFCPNEKLSW